MTEETKKKIGRWIITIAVAAAVLTSCAITINNVNHSNNVKIDSEQNASQQNDSTNFNANFKK